MTLSDVSGGGGAELCLGRDMGEGGGISLPPLLALGRQREKGDSHFTESVSRVVLKKLIFAQIRQIIIFINNNGG